MSGILADSEIFSAYIDGRIEITPFDRERLNPTSYDLALGRGVKVYAHWVRALERVGRANPRNLTEEEKDGRHLVRCENEVLFWTDDSFDVREEPRTLDFEIGEWGWVLLPGILYLMHTEEVVATRDFVPVLDGKSSIGRLGIKVHETAGFGDPGFSGQYTLEVTVQHRVRVFAGMRIAQMRFHSIEGKVSRPYDGNYQGEASRGAVASRAWKQFKEGSR